MRMQPKDEKVLERHLTDNSDDTIRRKLIDKYNMYFRLWKDFNGLVAIFAIIGLALACIRWENSFMTRSPDGKTITSSEFTTDLVIFLTAIIGAVAIVFKFYFESVWMQYKNPVAFYKVLV